MTERTYRPRGTGHVFARGNRWYGEFYVRGEKAKRSLGPVRQPGSRVGLTRTMAEQRLRDLMSEHAKAPPPLIDGRMTIADVGARRIASLARKGRRPDTTLSNYEADIRLHFAPFFGETPVDRITADDVEEFIDSCLDDELRAAHDQRPLKVSTVAKLYTHLSGIFDFAIRKHWCSANPCRRSTSRARPRRTRSRRSARCRWRSLTLCSRWRAPARAGTPRGRSSAPNSRATLRDLEKRTWKDVAGRLGCSPATAVYLYRATGEAVLEDDLARVERVLVPDRRDDRPAAGGAARAALAGHRLDRRPREGDVRDAQEAPAQDQVAVVPAVGADGRPGRRRARPAVQGVRLPVRRGPGVRAPAYRPATRPHLGDRPLPARRAARWDPRRRRVPRPAPHVRDDDGRRRRAAAHAAGVDGPCGYQDHLVYMHFAPAEDEVQTANRVFPQPGATLRATN